MAENHESGDFVRLQQVERDLAAVAARVYGEATALSNILSLAASMACTLEAVLNDPESVRVEGVARVSRAQIAAVRRMCKGSRFGTAAFRGEDGEAERSTEA